MSKGPMNPGVTKELLEQLYWGDESASIQDVANHFKCTREAVRRWLIHFGIPVKPRGVLGFKKMKNQQLRDRDWLQAQLETKNNRQIARELGVKDDVVSYWLVQHGLANESKSEAIKTGLRKANPDGRFGDKASNWKGGRRVTNQGYVKVYAPDHPGAHAGVVFEHRLVMEKKLGRLLEEGEIVHHIDGDKSNNHPDNLELTRMGAHTSEHFKSSHEVTRLRERVKWLEEQLEIRDELIRKFEQQENRIKQWATRSKVSWPKKAGFGLTSGVGHGSRAQLG